MLGDGNPAFFAGLSHGQSPKLWRLLTAFFNGLSERRFYLFSFQPEVE